MRRRKFLGSAALFSLFASIRPGHASPPAGTESVDKGAIDPYFLDQGEVPQNEQDSIADFEQYRDRVGMGKEAIMPRGGRPPRAPTYRFLHWPGAIGEGVNLMSPVSVEPAMEATGRCKMNAEILGFRARTTDFPKKKTGRGTLTVEIRVMERDEKLSWVFLQQFTAFEDGTTDMGARHICERNDVPRAMEFEEPTIDIRVQLMRHPTKSTFLTKVLKVAGLLGSVPGKGSGRLTKAAMAYADSAASTPALRIPRMPREGVALSQALLAGVVKDTPLWRSGYGAYSLTNSGGRQRFRPGIWVVIDESEPNVSELTVADDGGRIVLVRGDEPIDANYLILDFRIEEATS